MNEPLLTQPVTIDGHTINLVSRLLGGSFTLTIEMPEHPATDFRDMLIARANAWRRLMNAEHETCTVHISLQEGNILLEGSGWTPQQSDIQHLAEWLQGAQTGQAMANARAATVAEDLETPIPPLRIHDVPESVRGAEQYEPLLAPTG